MKFLGLTPDAIAARNGGTLPPAPGLPRAVGFGGAGFAAVSTLAYGIWAWRLMPESPAMYAVIALVYIGLGGAVLGRLVTGPGSWPRFALGFALVFLAYAVIWSAFWFGLGGKRYGDLWGALLGLAALVWLLRRAFGVTGGFSVLLAVLFVLHSAGYYAGGVLKGTYRGSTGMLLWGTAHGAGFGAGLGYALWRLQAAARASAPGGGA